jgi:hypothetical protein
VNGDAVSVVDRLESVPVIATTPGIYHWISRHGQHSTDDRRRFINGEAAA